MSIKQVLGTSLFAASVGLMGGCAAPKKWEGPLAPIDSSQLTIYPAPTITSRMVQQIPDAIFQCLEGENRGNSRNIALSKSYAEKLLKGFGITQDMMNIRGQCIEIDQYGRLSPDAKKVEKIYNQVMLKIADKSKKRIGLRQDIIDDADMQIWGLRDYWATGLETAEKGDGDCEDIILATYELLLTVGLHPGQMMLGYLIIDLNGKKYAHMQLLVLPTVIPDTNISTLTKQQRTPIVFDALGFGVTNTRFSGYGITLNPVKSYDGKYSPGNTSYQFDKDGLVVDRNGKGLGLEEYGKYFQSLLHGRSRNPPKK